MTCCDACACVGLVSSVTHVSPSSFSLVLAAPPRTLAAPNKHTKTLHLGYHDGRHYTSIRNANDNIFQPPTPISVGVVSNDKAKTDDVGGKPAPKHETKEERAIRIITETTQCTSERIVREALAEAEGDLDSAIAIVLGDMAAGGVDEADDVDLQTALRETGAAAAAGPGAGPSGSAAVAAAGAAAGTASGDSTNDTTDEKAQSTEGVVPALRGETWGTAGTGSGAGAAGGAGAAAGQAAGTGKKAAAPEIALSRKEKRAIKLAEEAEMAAERAARRRVEAERAEEERARARAAANSDAKGAKKKGDDKTVRKGEKGSSSSSGAAGARGKGGKKGEDSDAEEQDFVDKFGAISI